MSNFYGELLIRITSDTAGLSKGLQQSAVQTNAASKSMEAAGKKARVSWERVGLGMQNVGRTMTQFVTLPIAAGFAFATYSGYKYSQSLLQIKNLTGLTAAQTERYGKAMLDMSKYGVGPQKLAEAMYFISSSGFEAAEAMKVLDASAKASASGMGDVVTVADALTSAMNAYGHANLSASQATDILMKTIEVGKAEPEQLASSIGRILPIANQLDVDFAELGGNIAALTLGGLSAAESVTALRGTMAALVSPAKMSIETLKTMGLSYQEVTRSIAEKGLLPTLKMLWEATDHNMLKMREIIPNIRATTGVMSLLGEGYKHNLDVIEQVDNAQGKLNETYKSMAKTPLQQVKVALASIQSSFVKMGVETLPMVASIAGAIAGLLESVGNMSEGWRKAIMWMGLFAAAAGPVIMVAGSIIRSVALIRNSLASLSMVKGLGASLAAFKVGGVVEGVTSLTAALGPLRIALAVVAASAAVGMGLRKLSDWLDGTTERINNMRKAAEAVAKDESLKEWSEKKFGGYLKEQGGKFVWRVDTEIKGDTGLLAKWVKTEAAKARVAGREELQKSKIEVAEGNRDFFEQQIKDTEDAIVRGTQTGKAHIAMSESGKTDAEAYILALRTELAYAETVVQDEKRKLADLKIKDQAIVFKAKIEDVKDKMAEVKKLIKENAGKPHTTKMLIEDRRLKERLEDLKAGLTNITKKSYFVRLQLRAEKLNNDLGLAKRALEHLKTGGGAGGAHGGHGARGAYDPEVSADISKLTKFIAKGEKRAKDMKDEIESQVPKLTVDNKQALRAVDQVKEAVAALKDKTITLTVLKDEKPTGRAYGGIDVVSSPTLFRAGEGGSREIAAFFPLNDPNRTSSLFAQLNSMLGNKTGGNNAANAGRIAPTAGGDVFVLVKLDSTEIAARQDVLRGEEARRAVRVTGGFR